MNAFTLDNISKDYRGLTVFENLNLVAHSGEIITIKGKSGVGKSTLLNIIAGLEKQTFGTYILGGVDITNSTLNTLSETRSEHIGYISQNSPIIPNLSVLDNISIPFWFKSNSSNREHISSKIEELSQHFEVNHLLSKKIEELSGGERQRIGIIRALVDHPNLVVADEPTAALDEEMSIKVMNYFNQLKKSGVSVVIATHSNLVAEQSDKIYILSKNGLVLETS